ncbi:MAG TPA: hypothetical protein VFP30_07265 [Candidatus Limnocylindria bacterium]|nr:hypothetical protein [Candidatus Limnocylindria bacterium]
MGQVNVNSGGTEPVGEPTGSSGAGFILGIIVAIIVIAALVYFLVLNGGNGDNGGTDNGGTDNGNGGEVLPSTDDGGGTAPSEAAPSGWVLVTRA